MKLRFKLFTLLTVSYLLIFIIMQVASNSVLLGGMIELENRDITVQTIRGIESINNVISEVESTTRGFSSFSDVARFVNRPELVSEDYVWSTLNDAVLQESDINYLLFFDQRGEAILDRGYDYGEEFPVPQEFITFFEMNSILVVHQTPESKLSGLLKTPIGLCVISSQPIVSGLDVIGSIVACRVVDSGLIDELGDSLFIDLSYHPLLDEQSIMEYETVISSINADNPILISKPDEETVTGYSLLNDLYGNPAMMVSVASPRLIYGVGVQMVNYFVLSFVLIGISIGMLVLLALNRLVVMPLSKLSSEVGDIKPQTIKDNTVTIPGDDEISALSQDIDRMLVTLREYQNRIKETERMVSIGATATMVGHDLRNPLQVVVMLTDLIQRKLKRLLDKVPEEEEHLDIQRLTHRIKEQATYMNKIVSDLQGLTKGLSLEIQDVDIVTLVEEVLETVVIPPNINLKTLFDEAFPEIFADKAKLQRVFTNLVLNAVQAMPGGGELVVKGHFDAEKVYISVIDTGCGIPEENLERIFNPLFTTKAKGTGLGLTVCKRIIEAHGGEIITKSHPDIGTRFTVSVPIKHHPEMLMQGEEGLDYAAAKSYALPNYL